MADTEIQDRINALSDEQDRLYSQASHADGLTGAQADRIREIREEIDRAYDLLHQRQARRNAGMDPDDAEPRPAAVVERYLQ